MTISHLLSAQIDAAINPGNSGGPVLAGDKLVGIVMQAMESAENVGYMIPVSVVRHFLEDLEDGRIDGFPRLGINVQEMDSPSLRESFGLTPSQTGTVVTSVDHGSPSAGVLQRHDVLLAIDGEPIANDMSVSRPTVGRVHFSEVSQSKQMGGQITLTILRGGEVLERTVRLTPYKQLVPGRGFDEVPQYLVFGGLLFQPLTIDYLMYFEEIPYDLGDLATNRNRVTADRSEIILIQKVLPHPVNRGYQTWEDYVVDTVNGVVPRDLKHLASIIGDAETPFLQIVTRDDSVLTLDLQASRAAQPSILSNFGIAHDRSPDLRVSELVSGAR